MTKQDFQLTVLGARGSMAAGRADSILFGGDTSCYMVRAGDETVFLDAGSGIASAPESYPKPPIVLISHLHLDHIMGLGMFPILSDCTQRCTVYLPFCEEAAAAEYQIGQLFHPPVWPLSLHDCECSMEILPMPKSMEIGSLYIDTMPGNHPGGCMVFRLQFQGKSIVYVTDYEHSEPSFSRLAEFARDTDLLLYDAQYASEIYPKRRGYGHSTAEKGLELMQKSNAKQLLLIHHAPTSTDSMLLEREKMLSTPNASFAREGQTITL